MVRTGATFASPIVEPSRLVIAKTGRQDLGLPASGCGFETFELLDDRVQGIGSLHARIGRDTLPVEQKAHEIAHRNGLDFRAQALHGIGVDTRQQPALAPFFHTRLRRKAAAHREALGLERGERGRDIARRAPQWRGERGLGHRA